MSQKPVKKLKASDIVLFTFAAVFVLDSFAAAAAIGWQSIVWLLILALVYFLPYGFISAELGAAIGDQGGIFAWVSRAFGRRWAIRSSWYYWINVALWMPSVFIAFSSTLSYAFFGNQLSLWSQIGIAISLIFLTTCLNFLSIDQLKWLPNLSSVAKLIVTLALIGAGIVWLVQNRSVSTPVLDPDFGLVPSWSKGVMFLPVIIYNLSGFELSSNTSSEMANPSRAIPKSIIIAGLTTIVAYVLGTAAVNIVLDVKQIDISNGLIDTIKTAFNLPWLVEIIALFLLFTFFGNMITWTAGANRTIIESAQSGAFPALFASRIRATNGPLWSSIITGLVSTLVVLLAGALSTDGKISDLFWSIYAFSAVVFLLPYLLIFPAYLKLRLHEPDLARPFKIRGPLWVQVLISVLPTFIVLVSIFLYVFGAVVVGEKTFALNDGGMQILFCLVGTALTILVGEALIFWHARRRVQGVSHE